MKNNNKNNWYIKLFSLLKLETATRHGRVNLAGVIVVAGFAYYIQQVTCYDI